MKTYSAIKVSLVLFSVPIFSTLIGGLVAIRFRRLLPLLIAIGAGLLLGAAFLDLLPDAISLGVSNGLSSSDVLGLTLVSFLIFYAIENGLQSLKHRWKSPANSNVLGHVGAGMLIFHSFRDGMAIGAAFAASHPAGYAVALGIAAHDLGDGMNTIILTTGGNAARRSDYCFLAADAIAPFLGGFFTLWWVLSSRSSVYLLVLAAGFFLQMATGDFLPELKDCKGPRRFLLPSVLFGALLIYGANLLISWTH